MSDEPLLYTEVEADVLEEFVVPPATIALDGLAKFRWTSDFLHIRVVDPASTITVEQKVTPEVFDVYDVDVSDDGELITGVDCNLLLDFIKKASESEIVTFEATIDKLNIKFGHMGGEFSSINPDTISEPNERSYSHSAKISAPRKIFSESEDIASLLGPEINFSISDDKLDILCSGDENSIELNYEAVLEKSKLDKDIPNVYIDNLESKTEAQFSYDLYRHLSDFVPKGYFTVKVDNSGPLLIKCNRANNRIPTTIALAQRIDPG